MNVLLEIICLPFTILVWIISFLFVFIFCFDMFRKMERGNKSLIDVLMDINILVHRTNLVDWYFNTSPYIRTIIAIIIYYNLL